MLYGIWSDGDWSCRLKEYVSTGSMLLSTEIASGFEKIRTSDVTMKINLLSYRFFQKSCSCREIERLGSASEEKDFSRFTISQTQGFLRTMTVPSEIMCERSSRNVPSRKSPWMACPDGASRLRTTPYRALASIYWYSLRACRIRSTPTVTSVDASVSFALSCDFAEDVSSLY